MGVITEEDGIKKMISRLDTEEEKELAVKSFDHWHEYNLVQKPEMGDLVRDLKAKGYGIYFMLQCICTYAYLLQRGAAGSRML